MMYRSRKLILLPRFAVVLLFIIRDVESFSCSSSITTRNTATVISLQQQSPSLSSPTCYNNNKKSSINVASTLQNSRNDNEVTNRGSDEDDEYDAEDDTEDIFVVTPTQIRALRKEADKRRAFNKLGIFLLPINESEKNEPNDNEAVYSIDTLQLINDLFQNHELIEVRGISTTNHRSVKVMTEQLAFELEDVMNKPVIPIEITRGYRAVLYSPSSNEHNNDNAPSNNTNNTIQLRTKYKPNQWKKKPKAIRDIRGQIIKDENGNIIRQ